MPHRGLCCRVPEVVADGPTGQRLKCRCRDELSRGPRHHDLHFGTAITQPAHEVRALVGCNASGYAEKNAFSLHLEGPWKDAAIIGRTFPHKQTTDPDHLTIYALGMNRPAAGRGERALLLSQEPERISGDLQQLCRA